MEEGHKLHPLVPPDEAPVYPAAQTVQAEGPTPTVPLLGVLKPGIQVVHPEDSTSPLLE